LEGLVVQHLTVARVADGLGVSWNTANNAVLAEGQRALIDDPTRFDGVAVLGVDEHVWRHTRRGDKYVTVIIDLTPVRDHTGPARLIDMVEGRSKQAFQRWLAERDPAWRDGVEVVAMDGFTGFKTATAEELPDAVAVMDPFHVVRLAGDALDQCRRRIQQIIHGHRGRANDPLYRARRTLHTGADLLTDKQQQRLQTLFADDAHVQVEATWGIYQRMIAAYRQPDRVRGRQLMVNLIDALSSGVPEPLTELITLGWTLKKRAVDVLAYFDRPGSSNGPTEAINGRLEHLRGSALGFRNLTNYVARCLLEAGGFRPRLHPHPKVLTTGADNRVIGPSGRGDEDPFLVRRDLTAGVAESLQSDLDRGSRPPFVVVVGATIAVGLISRQQMPAKFQDRARQSDQRATVATTSPDPPVAGGEE
jgi:hypothetical protein